MTADDISTDVRFTDEMLGALQNFDDVLALFKSQGVEVQSAEDFGTGFRVVEKQTLVGVPFVILEFTHRLGDFGDYVSVLAVTRNGSKVVFNDGSTGVCSQLALIADQRGKAGHPHPTKGLLVERGLSRSDYTAMIPNRDGELVETPATTFYLDI